VEFQLPTDRYQDAMTDTLAPLPQSQAMTDIASKYKSLHPLIYNLRNYIVFHILISHGFIFSYNISYLLVNPAWIFHESLRDSEVVMLDPRETKFFQELIERYLYPLVENKDHQQQMVRDLKSLRNNGCFIFFMINTLWLVIIFSLQLVSEQIRDYVFIPIKRLHNDPLRFEPLGLGFLLFFATILLVQFISMLWHRYGTLLHLLASTDLKVCQRNNGKNNHHHRRGDFTTDNVEDAVEQVKVLQQLKGFHEEGLPEPDYDDNDAQLASEPDLSTTGLIYRGDSRFTKHSACISQQWSDTAKVNDMQRNLDTTDHSEMSQM
jgi:hypothetical protein